MDLGKRALKVLDQFGEAPLYRAFPRDQDIIIAFHARDLGRRAAPPPSTAAAPGCGPPRRPKSLGGGEAEAGDMRVFLSPATRRRACSTSDGAVQRAPPLTCRNSARVLRRPIAVTGEVPPAYADRRLRPLALRRASTFRPPLVAMRARKPWRRLRTSRDGWKVRFKGASPGSIAPAWEPRRQGARIGDPGAYRVRQRPKSILAGPPAGLIPRKGALSRSQQLSPCAKVG